MECELGGNVFPLRADFLAIKRCEDLHGVRIEQLDDAGLVVIGTMVFEFAKRGSELNRAKFEFTLDDFLGLIEINQTKMLGEVVQTLLGLDEEKKT